MLVQHIELVRRRLLERLTDITVRRKPAAQFSANTSFFGALLRSWTVLASDNRPVPQWRATATAGIHRGADHETFSLQHSQMITRSIEVHFGFGRKILERLSRMALDSVEEAYPGLFCEAPEIFNSARHMYIISSRHFMTTWRTPDETLRC